MVELAGTFNKVIWFQFYFQSLIAIDMIIQEMKQNKNAIEIKREGKCGKKKVHSELNTQEKKQQR
jgi:hypothetical protein